MGRLVHMEEPRFFRFLTAKRFLMEAPAFPKVGMGRAASGGAEMFFGAARMFTASLAVAKPPPSRRRACRPRSRAKRPGGLLRRGGCGRFAPCPPGAGGTQTLRGADKQTLSALALSGRLCRFSGKRSRCSLSAGVGDGGIGSRAGLCAEAPPQGELLSGAKLRESHKMGV